MIESTHSGFLCTFFVICHLEVVSNFFQGSCLENTLAHYQEATELRLVRKINNG